MRERRKRCERDEMECRRGVLLADRILDVQQMDFVDVGDCAKEWVLWGALRRKRKGLVERRGDLGS